MPRKIVTLISTMVLAFVITLVVIMLARNLNYREGGMVMFEPYEDCYFTELRNIVLVLYSRSEYQRDDSEEVSLDEEDVAERLRVLINLFRDARRIQNGMRGLVYEGFEEHKNTLVITGFGMPNYIGGTFDVGFAHDRYVEMIDFVIEFLGVPREMVSYRVIGVIKGDPTVGQPTGFELDDK